MTILEEMSKYEWTESPAVSLLEYLIWESKPEFIAFAGRILPGVMEIVPGALVRLPPRWIDIEADNRTWLHEMVSLDMNIRIKA